MENYPHSIDWYSFDFSTSSGVGVDHVMQQTVPSGHCVLVEKTCITTFGVRINGTEHWPRAASENRYKSIIQDTHSNATMFTYPPSHAIFRFRLKKGFKSHAGKPPGIDASAQIFSSVSELHASRFSLGNVKKETGLESCCAWWNLTIISSVAQKTQHFSLCINLRAPGRHNCLRNRLLNTQHSDDELLCYFRNAITKHRQANRWEVK